MRSYNLFDLIHDKNNVAERGSSVRGYPFDNSNDGLSLHYFKLHVHISRTLNVIPCIIKKEFCRRQILYVTAEALHLKTERHLIHLIYVFRL